MYKVKLARAPRLSPPITCVSKRTRAHPSYHCWRPNGHELYESGAWSWKRGDESGGDGLTTQVDLAVGIGMPLVHKLMI